MTVELRDCFINMAIGKKISLLTLESGMLVETVSEVNDWKSYLNWLKQR